MGEGSLTFTCFLQKQSCFQTGLPPAYNGDWNFPPQVQDFLLNFMGLLSSFFSSLLRSLWMATQSLCVSTTPHCFLTLSILISVICDLLCPMIILLISWIFSELLVVGKKKKTKHKKQYKVLYFFLLLICYWALKWCLISVKYPYFQDIYEKGSDAKGVIRSKTVKYKWCNSDAMT